MRFIIGIVKTPVVMTLETALPEIVPNMPDVITATLAGPPGLAPARARPKSMKSLPVPVFSTNAPKMMNSTTYVADTLIGMPRIPSVVM